MEFFKKQKVAFYGLCVSAILVLIGMIMFEFVYSAGYEAFGQQTQTAGTEVIVYTIIAIALFAVAILLSQFSFEGVTAKILSVVVDLALIAAGVLIGMAIVSTISAYVYDVGIWVGSDLHNGDDALIATMKLGIASTVVYVVGLLVASVTTCFSIVKK